jgi:hypothetical protein
MEAEKVLKSTLTEISPAINALESAASELAARVDTSDAAGLVDKIVKECADLDGAASVARISTGSVQKAAADSHSTRRRRLSLPGALS